MNEYVGALVRLYEQLLHSGVPALCARHTVAAYTVALNHPSEHAWRAFYVSVYRQLEALCERPLPFVGSPALPLLTLLGDDLGIRLIPQGARERIRRTLVEYPVREASLSS